MMLHMKICVTMSTYDHCWGALIINWNNGYHMYRTHEVGTNMVTSEWKYQ